VGWRRSGRKPRFSPAVYGAMSAQSAAGDFEPINKSGK
jgi:hypothetical protein